MSVTHIATPGLLFVHAVPESLVVALEAQTRNILGQHIYFDWARLPSMAFRGTNAASVLEPIVSCEVHFDSDFERVSMLASQLAGFRTIWFEVTLEFSSGGLGQRFCHTPNLGLYHSQLDDAGNQVFSENQLRWALSQDKVGKNDHVRLLLGDLWDDQLEPLRALCSESAFRADLAS